MDLFTYGSLMFPEVWALLTGGGHPRANAFLDGFNRRRIKDDVYPVILPGTEGVSGVLYSRLSEIQLSRLDRFEGELYQRIVAEVRVETGRRLPAQVYVLRPPHHHRADGPWDPAWFRREGLPLFLQRYQGFLDPTGHDGSP